MTRLYFPSLQSDAETIIPDRENSRYLLDVLRCCTGDRVIVFDGTGTELECTAVVEKRSVRLKVVSRTFSENRPLKNIVHLQGLLKGQKMDLVIQKLAELGISRFMPVVTGRSQVKNTSKHSRWTRIAEEASRQCRRTDIMKVDDILDVQEAIGLVGREHPGVPKLVFYEGGGVSLASIRESVSDSPDVVTFTGPEGGFSDHEIGQIEKAGFVRIFLGGLILRAETAAIVSAGIVQYIVGQFDRS